MSQEAKTVTCPGCGNVMRIPPEYANTPGRCGKCGATVNEQPPIPRVDLTDVHGEQPLIQRIDLSDLKSGQPLVAPLGLTDAGVVQPLIQSIDLSDLDRSVRRPAPKAPQPPPEPMKRVLLRSMLMGLAGALVCGAIIAAYFTLRRAAGQTITIGTLFANADPGFVLGFTLCSLYVVVKHLNWGPFKAAGLGVLTCGIVGTLTFAIEAAFVAPPDMGMLTEIVMACMAGGVAGLVLGAKLNSDD